MLYPQFSCVWCFSFVFIFSSSFQAGAVSHLHQQVVLLGKFNNTYIWLFTVLDKKKNLEGALMFQAAIWNTNKNAKCTQTNMFFLGFYLHCPCFVFILITEFLLKMRCPSFVMVKGNLRKLIIFVKANTEADKIRLQCLQGPWGHSYIIKYTSSVWGGGVWNQLRGLKSMLKIFKSTEGWWKRMWRERDVAARAEKTEGDKTKTCYNNM